MSIQTHPPKIISVGGIIYHHLDDDIKYLIIKRFSLGKKIERVVPKGKVESGESLELTCLREIKEEVNININDLSIKQHIGDIDLAQKGIMDKLIKYYLVEYRGNPDQVKPAETEGFLGVYKRADIHQVMALITHASLRDIFREAHLILSKSNKISKLIDQII